jgi:hypothetical protein
LPHFENPAGILKNAGMQMQAEMMVGAERSNTALAGGGRVKF